MLSNGAEGLQPRAHDGNLGLGFKSQFAIVNGVKRILLKAVKAVKANVLSC